MNTSFKTAKKEITDVVRILEIMISEEGDDISCFNPNYLDEIIHKLGKARSHLAVGRYIDDKIDLSGRLGL